MKALLVNVFFSNKIPYTLAEFAELVDSAGVVRVGSITFNRQAPAVHCLIGKGQLHKLKEETQLLQPEVIIFNCPLGASQERELERYLNVRVIDRIGLILDIFAQRARSYEGKLQVELAQLEFLSSRLVRGWTHLERQKGGIGLRGPGETQLETDKRLVGKRIKAINKRLGRVKSQREQSRRKRKKNAVPIVALVGYTNAGKSTLLNALTGANVGVANQLFATLDPTLRKLALPSGKQVIIADTVGFIADLPPELIKAFNATLEEINQADLLLHVIDIGNVEYQSIQALEAAKVLNQIGANDIPSIRVYNKSDQYVDNVPKVDLSDSCSRVWVSARKQTGLDDLLACIDIRLHALIDTCCIKLPFEAGQLRAHLFDLGVVREERICHTGGWIVNVEMDQQLLYRLCQKAGFARRNLQMQV